MPWKLYIDSRRRVKSARGDADTSFAIALPYPITATGKCFVDVCLIPNSFYTIRSGENDIIFLDELTMGMPARGGFQHFCFLTRFFVSGVGAGTPSYCFFFVASMCFFCFRCFLNINNKHIVCFQYCLYFCFSMRFFVSLVAIRTSENGNVSMFKRSLNTACCLASTLRLKHK